MAYALPAAAPLVAAARGDAPKLNAALAAARARLLQPAPAAGGALSLALGNEACDLDSIACSLAYALEVDTRAAPVLNVARAELPLRNEAAWLLGAVGVDSAALTFADELDLEALCGTEGAAVALLDHNVPAPAQAFLAPAVRAVVDHHDDAARFGEARPRVVAPVGSCATLVAEMLLELEGGVEGVNAALRLLLLSAVLVDTANLDASVGRATPRDAAVVEELVRGSDGEGFRAELFAALTEAKYDQSALGVDELLVKDYKQWQTATGVTVGIAGFGVPLGGVAEKEGGAEALGDAVDAFATRRGLDVLLVMTAFYEGAAGASPFRRQLALAWARGGCGGDPVAAGLLQSLEASEDLVLEDISARSGWPAGCRVFEQRNLKATRKKVAPLMLRHFESSDEVLNG